MEVVVHQTVKSSQSLSDGSRIEKLRVRIPLLDVGRDSILNVRAQSDQFGGAKSIVRECRCEGGSVVVNEAEIEPGCDGMFALVPSQVIGWVQSWQALARRSRVGILN